MLKLEVIFFKILEIDFGIFVQVFVQLPNHKADQHMLEELEIIMVLKLNFTHDLGANSGV